MQRVSLNICGILDCNEASLRVGDSGLSIEDIRHLATSPGALVWVHYGFPHVLQHDRIQEMYSTICCREQLERLGRTGEIPSEPLEFTWDQTISLEEYLDQFRKPLDGQTQDKPG